MERSGSIGVAVVSLFAALAGCASSEGGDGLPEGVDPDLGSIHGFIVDESNLPVATAQVWLAELIEVAGWSDDDGSFSLWNVPAGTYKVSAGRIGYDGAFKDVTVADGQRVEEVLLEIATIPDPATPFYVPFTGEGYIACGFKAATVTVSNINVCAFDANHKPQIDFPVKASDGLTTVVQEFVWEQSSVATGSGLAVYLWKNPNCNPPPCGPENEYGAAGGESPLRLVVGNLTNPLSSRRGINADGETLLSSMTFVGGGLVVVQLQQRVTHYITVFYNGEPDPEFSQIEEE